MIAFHIVAIICLTRLLYTYELDPLTLALQEEIERDPGFNKDHIFYKLILYGLKCATATPRNFQCPDEIVEFVDTLESTGGSTTCNLLRGPGNLDTPVCDDL